MENRGEEDRIRCKFCGGVWHPSTGGIPYPNVYSCGRCEREFLEFVKWQVRRWAPTKKRPGFYDSIFIWKIEELPKEESKTDD